MRRAGLLLVLIFALPLRGDDAPARPAWCDEATWRTVKDAPEEPLRKVLDYFEEYRRLNATAFLEDIERRRNNAAFAGAMDEIRPLFNVASDPAITALNAVGIENATLPRLSGNVVRIGVEGGPPTLRLGARQILPGDLVVVPAGRDVLDLSLQRRGRVPAPATAINDIAIVGSGVGKTTLQFFGRKTANEPVHRMSITDCTIELPGHQVMVTGCSLALRHCAITNFRGPAFRGQDALLLLEDCVLDGADATDSRGFDLLGNSVVLVRRTTFRGMGSLAGSTPTFPFTFDECSTRGWRRDLCRERTSSVFLRQSEGILDTDIQPAEMEVSHLLDAEPVVAFAAGEAPAPDPRTARLVTLLDLPRSLPYWIGLLRASHAKMRPIAARVLERLAGIKVPAAEGADTAAVDSLVTALDADDWERREDASARLEALGEKARAAVEGAARSGSPEQRDRARTILKAIDDRPFVGGEPEVARLLRWFEATRERLSWDEAKKRWIEKDFK
jgi:hypothetical protein